MKRSKILGILTVAAMALMAFASTASATTLEVKGAKQTTGISFELTLKSGTSSLQSDTSGFFENTCTVSTVKGNTESSKVEIIEGKEVKTALYTATGAKPISGPATAWSWSTATTPCKEGNPTVHAAGRLSFEWINGTTNATLKSSNAEWTTPSAFGLLTCKTAPEGTDLGTLTGVAAGNATLDINAVLNCGIDRRLTGTYTVTSPEGLGVVE